MPRPATWGRWSPAPHDLARLDACLSLARLGAKVDAFFAGQSDPRDDLQLFADFVADLFHFAANVDLIDTETGASVGEQVARAFSDSEFQWSAVERMLRLASPSPDFRTGVVYCTATVIRLQIMLPQPPYLSLRQKWDEAKGHLDTAAVEINKARQWLDGRGDCDELLAQASESVEVLLRRARTRADKLHGDRRGGRPPML